MTELICHQEKMTKPQAEIDQVLGKDKSKSIQESNISNLHYIQTIAKETLRLHSAAPLLVPHKAEKDVQLCGYCVPKNAQVWVHVWCIGQDPNVWPKLNHLRLKGFWRVKLILKDIILSSYLLEQDEGCVLRS